MNNGSEAAISGSDQMNQIATQETKLKPHYALILVLALQLVVYADTYWSMVQIWWRSETFAHGFLIFPISLYLLWTRRDQLKLIASSPDYKAFPFLALCGFLWLLAHLADVLVVKQFAVVAMIPFMVWVIYGLSKIWAMAFPLAFLLFAVPAGELLVPPMMEFTADFTVAAVRMTGIPVFREGLYFTLPSGSWSVVEACSGVRYIIASLTLGCLYAYLTYYSLWRRALFIFLAILTPIIANGLRAYMIVMIGHLSSMKLATGVDHLIYGWVWFGVVMFILFWLGSFWRDKKPEAEEQNNVQKGTLKASPRLLAGLFGLTVAVLVAWPLWANYLAQIKIEPRQLLSPASVNWEKVDHINNGWKPIYVGASQLVEQSYESNGERVGLYLGYYQDQKQGSELISANNTLIDEKETGWKKVVRTQASVKLSQDELEVVEVQLKSGSKRLLVWNWNVINSTHTVNNYYAKLLESWSQISGKGREGAGIVVFTAIEGDEVKQARNRLTGFVGDMLPAIEAAVTSKK